MVGTTTTSYTRREISKFKLEYRSWIPCNTLLLSDICRWLVEEEDTEVVGRATTNDHLISTQKCYFKSYLRSVVSAFCVLII